jgi:hypothetical protein
MLEPDDVVDTIGTGVNAVPAETASYVVEAQLPVGLTRFGILTPQTIKRAPFQEDRGPDARAVMRAEPLNIYNESL